MDAAVTALRGASCITLSKLRITSVRQGIDPVAGTAYWAVFIGIEGHG
jgi:hypothetical protein